MSPARLVLTLALAGWGPPVAALELAAQDLMALPLEDLMDIEVTSVSRRSESLQQAPAAIFVITGAELRRSGARTIPDALRLVPGLHVARIGDINTHAVSSRGFADRLSNKLEVLVDGRTVYTPLFSGVFWDTVDTFLPDIERIEVIRGPGAALWGTNAITGVINIITRSADTTQGTHGYVQAGTEERSAAGLRAGGSPGGAVKARVYARQHERDSVKTVAGGDTFTVSRFRQAGFRTDTALAPVHALTVSGDVYRGGREDLFEAPPQAGDVETSGGNVTARWVWQTGERSELTAQAYYDHSRRRIPDIVFREQRDMADLDVQQRLALGERQTLVLGAGYRQSRDVTGTAAEGFVFTFNPAATTLDYYTAFVQDQIVLSPAVELTLGAKAEHNEYTGWELQPTARIGWGASESVFAWAAVSRAVRTPNRLDHDSTLFGTFAVGNSGQRTEKLLDHEIGVRWSRSRLSADVTAFYNEYRDLASQESNTPFPSRYGNGVEGHGYGAEAVLGWQPRDALDLRLTYAWLKLSMGSSPGSTDTSTAPSIEGASPQHQAGLRANWAPVPWLNLHAFLRHVGTASRNAAAGAIPAYTDLNLRLAWQASAQLELALAGENLLDAQHGELRSVIGTAYVEAPRSGLVELTWRWD